MKLRSKILLKKNVEKGDFEEALIAIEDNLKYEPDDPYSNFYKAKILYSLNRNAEALVPLKKAIYFDSKNYEIAMLAADIFSSLKYFYKAEDFYKYILKNKPDNAVAMANYACLKSMTGQDGEANYLIKKAIKLDPKNELVSLAKYKAELIQKDMYKQAKMLDKIKTHVTGSDYKIIVDCINHIENKNRKLAEDLLKIPNIKNEVSELIITLLEIERGKKIIGNVKNKINWKLQIFVMFLFAFCGMVFFHMGKYMELIVLVVLYMIIFSFSLLVSNTRKKVKYSSMAKES